MTPEKDFATKVLELACTVLPALVPPDAKSSSNAYTVETLGNITVFRGAIGAIQSDSIIEVSESVIHLVEEAIKRKLAARDVVYFNIMLPESQFDKYFKKNPNGSVSLYTDTFRRVVAQLRKEFKV